MTHTPGPWTAHWFARGPDGGDGIPFVSATSPTGCTTIVYLTAATNEQYANARLIAAAPDLLEVARDIAAGRPATAAAIALLAKIGDWRY